ncbi:MAG: hypothetical protein Q8M88_10575 [Phenylobacterium sp.]|uniref:hypothetical protein n=1 Tax=Phenylobacterium sp. TaxID=1871053 RepID=UPI0027342D02|nr:hypothetical protein [Phenylobacterium sp.]MDP3174865.1 hypothetical protein [Phenylobacterium sp.]
MRLLPTYRYVSKTYFTDDNSKPALVIGAFVTPIGFDGYHGGYGIADLRLDDTPDAARWSAGVFASDLFDQHYVKESGDGGEDFGLPTYIAGDPRVVGISLSIRR